MTPDTQAIVQAIQTGFVTLSRTLVIGLVFQGVLSCVASWIEAPRAADHSRSGLVLPFVIAAACLAVGAFQWAFQ